MGAACWTRSKLFLIMYWPSNFFCFINIFSDGFPVDVGYVICTITCIPFILPWRWGGDRSVIGQIITRKTFFKCKRLLITFSFIALAKVVQLGLTAVIPNFAICAVYGIQSKLIATIRDTSWFASTYKLLSITPYKRHVAAAARARVCSRLQRTGRNLTLPIGKWFGRYQMALWATDAIDVEEMLLEQPLTPPAMPPALQKGWLMVA